MEYGDEKPGKGVPDEPESKSFLSGATYGGEEQQNMLVPGEKIDRYRIKRLLGRGVIYLQ